MDIEAQYNKIYRFCYYRLRNRELAEDRQISWEDPLNVVALRSALNKLSEQDKERRIRSAVIWNRYELKKISSRKLVWIVTGLLCVFCVYTIVTSVYSNEGVTMTYTDENGNEQEIFMMP